jgi:hypothetical protein
MVLPVVLNIYSGSEEVGYFYGKKNTGLALFSAIVSNYTMLWRMM